MFSTLPADEFLSLSCILALEIGGALCEADFPRATQLARVLNNISDEENQ